MQLRQKSSAKDFFTKLFTMPERVLALGFLAVILLGGLLLMLPVATVGERSMGVLPAMFTATSAVCVTGLSVIDIGNTLSLFGQSVLLVLIQIGGLGFMVIATLIMVALGKRISLRNRMLIRESMNQSDLGGMVRLTLWFFMMTVIIEGIGALFLMTQFIPEFGIKKGIWFAVFHSVSAFCNAGFDLMGNYGSLSSYISSPVVVFTVASLVILGGLGFSVILDVIHQRFHFRKCSLHTKLVFIITVFLLIACMLLIMGLEWNNPLTLGQEGLSSFEKVMNSFFQSVTFRTAGFSTLDQASLEDTSKLIGVATMFVGASPTSTGGGIKTTTAGLMILLVIAVVRGRDNIRIFHKQISNNTARRSMAIFFIGMMMASIGLCVLCSVERGNGFEVIDLMFEATSAFSTTGLSTLNTQTLSTTSQWLLMPLMYFGRVGPLTLALAIATIYNKNPANRFHYPEEKIMIG